MKKVLMVLASVWSLLPWETQAQDNIKPTLTPWTTSVYELVMSRYYGSIVGGIFYDGPMSFTGITLARKAGENEPTYYMDLSIGQKLDDAAYDKDGGNEYGIKFGRSGFWGSTNFPVHYDISVTYMITHFLAHAGDDVVQGQLQFDLPKMPFAQPYVTLYQFCVLNSVGSGTFIATGLVRNQDTGLKLFGKPLIASLEYRFGHTATDDLFFADEGATYHRLNVSFPYAITSHLSITPMWIGQIPAGGQDRSRAFVKKPQSFLQVMLTYRF